MRRAIPEVLVSLDAEWVGGEQAKAGRQQRTNHVLTWQLAVARPGMPDRVSSLIIEAPGPTRRDRLTLSTLLVRALGKAKREGVITAYPDKVALIAHFTRADLTTLRDWKEIRRHVDAVRRTFTTCMRPLTYEVALPSGRRTIRIILSDTMLLSPAGSSLAKLGTRSGCRR